VIGIVPVADGDIFLTAPLGWWTPKTASFGARLVVRTGNRGAGRGPANLQNRVVASVGISEFDELYDLEEHRVVGR
jgi:hypothetical protein